MNWIDCVLISSIKTKTDSITEVQCLNILSLYLRTVWQKRTEKETVVTASTWCRGQSLLGCYATLTGKLFLFWRIIVPSSSGPGTSLGLLNFEDEVTLILTTHQVTIDPSPWSSLPRWCVSQAVLLWESHILHCTCYVVCVFWNK